MIRAIRPSAMAQDDASLITGWNVSPNVGYTVVLTPGPSACGVLLFDADMTTAIASGAGLVGTAQPVVLLPQTGQTIGMVDADLGWHLLVTTTGTDARRTIRIGPAVDLPDEIHPIYTDDDMALARATAAINAGACYVDDVTVTCPLGLGAGIGGVASAPVDGVAVVGQVESITWTATPDGATTQAVIRRHTAIAPEAYTPPPAPPVLADDVAETDAATATSGNVLTNDTGTLTVVAVNGLSVNVGEEIAGSNGGVFVIGSDGAWTFDPDGDFAALSGSDTATTSVSYHASNGGAEASATLTVTVSADVKPWTPAAITTALWLDAADSSTITLNGSAVSEWRDKSGNARHAVQSTAASQPTRITNGVQFDGSNDYLSFSTAIVQNTTTLLMVIEPTIESAIGSVFGQWSSGVTGRSQLACNQASSGLVAPGALNPFNSTSTSGGGFAGYTSAFAISNMPTIVGLTCTIPGSENWKAYRDCALQDSATVTAVATGVNSALGANNAGNSGNPYDGKIREVVALHAVNDTDRQRIEGYLAHKWDALLGVTTLVDSLPSDHPYKAAAPTL